MYRHQFPTDDVTLFTTCIWMTRADDALKLLTVPTFLETDQSGIKRGSTYYSAIHTGIEASD